MAGQSAPNPSSGMKSQSTDKSSKSTKGGVQRPSSTTTEQKVSVSC